MAIKQSDKIKVRMLGRFAIFFNEKNVDLRFGASTKAMQILQLLMYRYPEGITSDELLDYLFAYDDVLEPKNNLKVSISQLRKRLAESVLPGQKFIEYRNGKYYWECPVEIDIDAKEFERTANLGLRAELNADRHHYCMHAIDLYTSDFMPELVGIDWATKLNSHYWNLYAECIRMVTTEMIANEEYEEAFNVLDRAFRMRHGEEWQILKIKCMMELGRWDDAKKIYQETVTTLSNDFNVGPSTELLEQYKRISQQAENTFSSLEVMTATIREKERTYGAYYCAFPGFIDSCRIVSRNMARSGISCYLMLIYVADKRGNVITNPNRLNLAATKLYDAIQNSLRRGDSFTQYNTSQFLIFLFGTNQENCNIVYDRVKENFMKNPVRGVQLFSQVTSCAFDINDDINFSEPSRWTDL